MVVVLEQEIWTILSPLIIKVELCLVVPANLHPYLSDRSYLAPLAPEFDQVWLFWPFFSFSWIFYHLFLVRKVCSWVWQCRLRLSWCSSSSAWSSPSPLHTGSPTTTLLTRGSCSKRDLSNFELQLSYKSSANRSRTTTAEQQKDIVWKEYEITSIFYPCLPINPIRTGGGALCPPCPNTRLRSLRKLDFSQLWVWKRAPWHLGGAKCMYPHLPGF